MHLDQQKIERIKNNLYIRSVDFIDNYYNFDWHEDSDKINSSQALAIDFWGCLKLSPYKTKLINMIFNKKEDNWDIILEYSDKKILSEKRSSQIDVLIESEHFVIIIESKFTEKDGGGCSQVKKTTHFLVQCNGDYIEQTNPVNKKIAKCSLTGKGIKYWDYINSLTEFDKNDDYSPCPFKKGEFQWMRNICFAEAYANSKQKKSESYLVYFKSDKCPISKKVENDTCLGELKGKIRNHHAFKPLSYNELLDKCIIYLDFDSNEKQIWIELKDWMYNKEKLI